MTNTQACRLACAAIHGFDDDIAAKLGRANGPTPWVASTYTTQPMEANLGPHCLMFLAYIYYNQIGLLAGGGVTLAVF